MEEATGETPDISEWLDFEICDLVWWWDTGSSGKPSAADDPRQLGRCLEFHIVLEVICVIGL